MVRSDRLSFISTRCKHGIIYASWLICYATTTMFLFIFQSLDTTGFNASNQCLNQWDWGYLVLKWLKTWFSSLKFVSSPQFLRQAWDFCHCPLKPFIGYTYIVHSIHWRTLTEIIVSLFNNQYFQCMIYVNLLKIIVNWA